MQISDILTARYSVNNLFKTLGCKIDTLSQNDLARLGLRSTAADSKRAILRTPVEFPTARAKRARR